MKNRVKMEKWSATVVVLVLALWSGGCAAGRHTAQPFAPSEDAHGSIHHAKLSLPKAQPGVAEQRNLRHLALNADMTTENPTVIEPVYVSRTAGGAESDGEFEQDPWEPFNDAMFSFNRQLDRFILKPVATAWNAALPDPVQRAIKNALDNTDVVRRVVNNGLQLKIARAGQELARFTINSTIGVAGLFDAANAFGIEQRDEDMGQTLAVYGAGPGPYLVLPFLPVTTVRDGIGFAVDTAMNPLNYILPYAAQASRGTTTGVLLAVSATDAINQRSLDLERYEGVEESVIDLYSAVRNAYLQKRQAEIEE